jgi:hypothetical protein
LLGGSLGKYFADTGNSSQKESNTHSAYEGKKDNQSQSGFHIPFIGILRGKMNIELEKGELFKTGYQGENSLEFCPKKPHYSG